MCDVALEVPLAALALGRRRQGDDASRPWVQILADTLDRTALTRGIAALEDDEEALASRPHPLLHLHELGLEALQLGLVDLARNLRRLVVLHDASVRRSCGTVDTAVGLPPRNP